MSRPEEKKDIIGVVVGRTAYIDMTAANHTSSPLWKPTDLDLSPTGLGNSEADAVMVGGYLNDRYWREMSQASGVYEISAVQARNLADRAKGLLLERSYYDDPAQQQRRYLAYAPVDGKPRGNSDVFLELTTGFLDRFQTRRKRNDRSFGGVRDNPNFSDNLRGLMTIISLINPDSRTQYNYAMATREDLDGCRQVLGALGFDRGVVKLDTSIGRRVLRERNIKDRVMTWIDRRRVYNDAIDSGQKFIF